MLSSLIKNLSIKSKLTLFTSLLLLITVLISVIIATYIASETLKKQVLANAETEIESRAKNISNFLNTLKKDVQVLSQSMALRDLIILQEKIKEDSLETDIQLFKKLKQEIAQDYYNLSSVRKTYLQLRYINKFGKEVIRVDNNKLNIKIILDEELQDKGKKNYFIETLKKSRNEFYMSDLNLNRERGSIEVPFNPVIRYALPVYDKNQEVQGIVIANVYASIIFDNIKAIGAESEAEMFLLDNQGYFLYNPDEKKRWGKDLQNDEKLGKYYDANFVTKVLSPNSQVLEKDANFFIHTAIFPLESEKDVYWVILQKISQKTILGKLLSLRYSLISVGLFIILISLIAAYFFANNFTIPIRQLQGNISLLMQGKIPEEIQARNNDEVGKMTSSFNRLVGNIEEMVAFAENLGEGNYDTQLELHSEVVLLDALNALREKLQSNKIENEKRKWTSEGLAYFSELLRKQENLKDVFNNIIQEVANYLNVEQVCFYLIEEDRLILSGFYGLDKKALQEEIFIGDGLMGQVAAHKEMVYLENMEEHMVPLSSATHQIKLKTLIVTPLKVQNHLEAVLEMASIRSFKDYELDFLKKLCDAIAVTVASIRSRENTHQLLIKTREDASQLETQEEELRQNMEELSAIHENLEEQNDELKVKEKELEDLLRRARENEDKINEKNEMLIAQETILRKNMEELQSTQEQLEVQNKKISRQHKLIQSSISYSTHIQEAILPSAEELTQAFKDYFLIYEPKDHISGDFYWLHQTEDKTFFALADCTGHGVPGGLMALIGANLLNQIVVDAENYTPNIILEKLHISVRKTLRQEEDNQGAEGMVITFCCFENLENGNTKLSFATTKQNLFYCDNKKSIHVIKGERKSIGGWQPEEYRSFKTESLILEKGTRIFLATDGIFDAPNRERKKFGTKGFINTLKSNKGKSFIEQKKALQKALHQHRKDAEQRDDVSVFGILV